MRKPLLHALLVLAVACAAGTAQAVEEHKEAIREGVVVNGSFEKGETLPDNWEPTKEKELTDEVLKEAIGLEKVPGHGKVIRLTMTKDIGERQGLGLKSDWIKIDGTRRYELSVKSWTDGPTPKVFCEGYSSREAPQRMSYRAMLNPPVELGEWRDSSREFPEKDGRTRFREVQWVRIKLYGYACAGTVKFDDVTLRARGR